MDHVADIFDEAGLEHLVDAAGGRAAAAGDAVPALRRARLRARGTSSTSGSSRACRGRPCARGKLVAPGDKVDLYLEGLDQHRGWFHSSLLAGVATRGPGALPGGAHPRLRARRARHAVLEVRDRQGARGRRQDRLHRSRACGSRRTAPSCCGCGRRPRTTRATSSSPRRSSISWASRTARSATPAGTCCPTCTISFPGRDRLEDQHLRELDLLVLGLLRERDHEIFEAYRRFSFHEVVRLMTDFVITLSAEYLDPVKDALYCEAPRSRGHAAACRPRCTRSLRTLATWMAPILCFTAQDLARRDHPHHRRALRRPRQVRAEVYLPRQARWAAPTAAGWRRSARAARRSCARWRRSAPPATSRWRHACCVRPSAADRPHWEWNRDHLLELCVVSGIEIAADDAPGDTEITVEESPFPACPRCWRRLGPPAADPRDPDSVRAARRRFRVWRGVTRGGRRLMATAKQNNRARLPADQVA